MTLLYLLACTEAGVKLDETGNGGESGGEPGGETQETDETAVTSALEVSPSELDLGVAFVGSSASGTVKVFNRGDSDLDLLFAITGTYAAAYGVNAESSTVGAGATTTVNVLLAPSNWGDHGATLEISSAQGASGTVAILAQVQVDEDGDGYGSTASGGGDCDDADGQVHPGAPETWYDGVDQDCDGANDYDQDGDTVPVDLDCDDEEPAAYPGNEETWYDGIDGDCLGGDDNDQDGDGYPLAEDCDDEDAAIHPGAEETWYDGIDQDCEGDDFDQDGDGVQVDSGKGDGDCDDTDPTVFPGADEVWYDGVDQDCSGGSDYDQDGDGVERGEDCADTDPTTTAPSPEVWDGADSDCDGYADDLVITDLATVRLDGDSGDDVGANNTIALGGDVDEDGVADLVVTTAGRGSYGYAWIVSGAGLASGALDDAARLRVEGEYDWNTDANALPVNVANAPMVDLVGDATADVLVGGGYESYYGAFSVFDGDSTGTMGAGDAEVILTGDSSGDYARQAAAGDFDGDGAMDVVVAGVYDNNTSGSPSTSSSGVLALFLSDDLGGEIDFGDGSSMVNGSNDNDYLGWALVLADVDDDGYTDVIAGAPGFNGSGRNVGAVYVLPGDRAGEFSDDDADSACTLRISGTTSESDVGSDALVAPADVDGDGALDLVLAEADAGSAWVFSQVGALSGELSVTSADITISGTGLATALTLTDFDGDGVHEVVLGASGDDTNATDAGAAWFFGAPWASAMTTSNASGVLWGATAGDAVGSGLGGGYDLDGDGRHELLVGATGQDGGGTSAGAVYVVPGR